MKKKNEMVMDNVPNPSNNVVTGEQTNESTAYVVTRAGFRVSEQEYKDANDPEAVAEAKYWRQVAKNSKDNSKVEIVKFDKKLHRIW